MIPRRPRRPRTRYVAAGDLSSTSRSGGRVAARRALTVAALSLFTVPFLAVSASAQDAVGTTYDPDPLSAVHAWLIYGGTVVCGFLLAFVLTALTSRLSKPNRYRPGQPWEHDTTWIGEKPEDLDGKRSAAAPGSGGASGTW